MYVSYTPYAMLASSRKKAKDTYYIRLSPQATRLIGDVQMVDVRKADNNKYIVLIPKNPWDKQEPGVSKLSIFQSSAYLYCTGRVNQQFFKREWFDKRKVKIKRRKNDNSIWICLEERIDDGSGTVSCENQGTGSGD